MPAKQPLSPTIYLPVLMAATAAAAIILTFEWPSPSAPSILLALTAIAIFSRRATVAILSASATVASVSALFSISSAGTVLNDGPRHSCSGVIKEMVEGTNADRILAEIDSIDNEPCRRFELRITVDNSDGLYHSPGTRLRFNTGTEDAERRMRLPFESDNDSYLKRHGLEPAAVVSGDSISFGGDATGLLNFLRRCRASFSSRLLNLPVNDNAASFLAATLTGEDGFVSRDTRQSFNNAGVAHILALSGTHVAVITMLLSLVLLPLHAFGHRMLYNLAIVFMLWFYAGLTGLSPSVTRAVIMGSLFLIARALERTSSPFNSIAIAALLILIFDPAALFSLSFQLSFLAVTGIIAAGDITRGRFYSLHPALRFLIGAAIATIAATIATAPLIALHFHIFPLRFLLTNLVVTAILPLLLTSGLISYLLAALSIPAQLPAAIVNLLYNLIESLTGTGQAVITNLYPSTAVVTLIYITTAIILSALILTRYRIILLTCSMILLSVTPVVNRLTSPRLPESFWILTGDSGGNQFIVFERDTAWLVTDRRHDIASNQRYRLHRRLSGLMGHMKIDSLRLMPERYSSALIDRRDDAITVGNTRFLFVNTPRLQLSADSITVDYAILSAPFKGYDNSDSLALKARHILIGADINHRVAKRLVLGLHHDSLFNLRDTVIYSSNAPSATR